ncbi:MAG: tetratricopeptide repeat protein [Chloroflexota bacterium]
MAFKSSRYLIQAQIGHGGMGVVYEAVDRLTTEQVALKRVVLPSVQARQGGVPLSLALQNLRLALAHEFRVLASLRHPNIISVLDYGFDETRQPYFTMPYLQEAKTILEAGQGTSLERRVQLIQEMLEALAYLHRRGILHRDIKPGNILVADGTVRVLDFGLAAAKGEAHESVGTWQYTAPEILLEGAATEAADLYSVGVLAYELFANEHPFDVYDPEFIDKVLYDPPDFSKMGVSEALTAVIAKLLHKRPEDRYPDADATIAALSAALGKPIPIERRSVRESYLQAATFVGRHTELDQLKQSLVAAQQGTGAAWLIGGESGVGKSRLLNELQTQALVDGFLVLRGQGVEEGGRPYQLWIDALRRLVLQQELDTLTAGVLQSIVPELDILIGQKIVAPPVLEENAARQRLFSTIAQLFQQTKQPILLILEDLQWTQESLELLTYVNRQISQVPIVIIGSYRDDERPNLPQDVPTMQVMTLARLQARDIAALSASMLGSVGQQPEVLSLLQRETEGNAFFLVEVVRALAEEAGRLSAIADISLPTKLFPQGIETIVERRLARVPETALALLPGAAILGRQLDIPLLEQLAASSGATGKLENWLTVCADAAIFVVENGRWQFAHDKLREGVLQRLTAVSRTDWHRQAAQAIETVYPDAPEQAGALVHHWHMVEDGSKERHYAEIAGDYARQQFLNAEAITYFSRAIELTSTQELAQTYRLLHSREQVYQLQGDREAQLQDIHMLQSLAELQFEQGYVDKRAEAALRLANYAEATADYPTAVSSAQQALAQAQAVSDVAQEAASHLALGRVLIRQGNHEEARTHLTSSLDLAQTHALPQIEADSRRFLGVAAVDLAQYEQSRDYYQQALVLYRQIDDPQGESTVLNNLAIVAYAMGDLSQSFAYWEEAQKIYDAIGDREGRGRILTNLCALGIGLGDFATAGAYGSSALQICREINVPMGECLNLLNLGLIAHFTEDAAAAETYSQEAREAAKAIGNPVLRGYTLLDSGMILARQDQVDEAAAFLDEALTLWETLEQESRLLETKAELAAIALEKGELVEAQRLAAPSVEHILAGKSLDGAARPFQIYFICYEVLTAVSDPRADQILTEAYNMLQTRADRISDVARRHSYLHNVPSHHQIIHAHTAKTD